MGCNVIEGMGKLYCFYMWENLDDILLIEEKKEKEIKE